MAPIKKCSPTRSHHKLKSHHHKPKISELVYKFLSLGKEAGAEAAGNCNSRRCRVCKRRRLRGEFLDSANSKPRGASMAGKRNESPRNSRIHRVKRRQTPREHTLSACLYRGAGGEELKKTKRYLQKAIDFGVESGYLIPRDGAYRVLKVSSDLMLDGNYTKKVRKYNAMTAKRRSPRRTPIRFEDYEVQEARRRKRRTRGRRRRRSRRGRSRRRRSRRRGRRRSRSEGSGEVVEVDQDHDRDQEYESNKQNEKKKSPDKSKRKEGNEKQNQSDEEKAEEKREEEEDGSDLSVDDDSDDQEGKKGENTTKS